MRLSWNNTLNKLCEPYIEQLLERFKHINRREWPTELYDVLQKVIDNIDRDCYAKYYDEGYNALENYASLHDIKDISSLFDGELKQVLVFVLEEEWADIFCKFTKLEAHYPFATGAFRRSMRDRAVKPHLRHIIFSLNNFIVFKASGVTPEDWIHRWEEFKYESLAFEDLFAVLINEGNRKAIDYFKTSLSASSNPKELTFSHLRAIVKGGNPELLEQVNLLLLKAGLQEGLRQAIMETADEGMPHSFLQILKTVKNNGLERFSSVKRAFGAWTGLGYEAAKEHVTNKQFEILYAYLADQDKANDKLQSKDALELYLALWSIGFYDIEKVEIPIQKIINEGEPHQIATALLFLNNIENSTLQASLAAEALRKHPDNHSILAGAIPMYLANFYWKTPDKEKEMEENNPGKPLYDIEYYFGKKENAAEDFKILSKLYKDLNKKETFDPYIFPWIIKDLTRDAIAGKICNIATVMHTSEWTDKVLEYISGVNPSYRDAVIIRLLTYPKSQKQIDFLIDNMGAGTLEVRKRVCEIVERLADEGRLTENDYRKMESLLRLKASETRISVIKILSHLNDEDAVRTTERLLIDKNNMKRLAGLEIVKQWSEKNSRPYLVEKLVEVVASIKDPDAQEKKLISFILKQKSNKSKGDKETSNRINEGYNYENGFGLYDPSHEPPIKVIWPVEFDADKSFTFQDPKAGLELMKKLMQFIEDNADLEFKTSWGETERLGHSVIARYGERRKGEMNVGCPELWIKFYKDEIKTTRNLLKLTMPFLIGEPDPKFEQVLKRFFGKVCGMDPYKSINDATYYLSAKAIVEDLFYYLNDDDVWIILTDLFSDIASRIKKEEIVKKISYHDSYEETDYWPLWLEDAYYNLNKLASEKNAFDDNLFKRYFAASYTLYNKSSFMEERIVEKRMPLCPENFLRAWKLGFFKDEDFLKELLGRPYSHYLIKFFSNFLPGVHNPAIFKGYGGEEETLPIDLVILVEKAVGRIMEIELQRGSTPTEVSHLATEIECVRGVDNFIGILVALGKDKLTKYSYNDEKSKKEVMSHLLSVCVPMEKDTPSGLKIKAQEAAIHTRRLVEAALYSPRWLDIVEEALEWKGLKSAAYYFLAHTGDTLEEIEKLKIGKYSKIEPDDFIDGAFDPDWFHEVYNLLGEARFNIVYEAAKYISEGTRHIRSRKLSDAVLGKLTAEQLMTEISAKRNKDSVVALGVVPLSDSREKDIEQRYLFLRNFLKEGKQFGAQRRAAEARAVKLALDNLARTAGFSDSTRLTLNIEIKLIENLSEFMIPKNIDGVEVCIAVEEGKPDLMIVSKGKKLNNIPGRLKNDPYISLLKEAFQSLKDQYLRGRELLENSMCDMTNFSGKEIKQLNHNPVMRGMLSHILLINELGIMGFPSENGSSLITIEGYEIEIRNDEHIRIVHAHDLFKSGNWSNFQKLLFIKGWKQPFKQIFRELYVATPEEKAESKSMRYSRHQIIPSKTASILKKRNWVLDYENGLQKVIYDSNLTAVLYAMADWFTPADIEAPTLEYVAFYDRHTGEEKQISEIDPIVFSEIMRDVDLVVSVAHAGMADPEASHSTIEMRKAILENIIPMFGLKNVEITDKYVKIKGELGNYGIHLGSGIIHQDGGAEIAVIPVHSQSRGRIFMPFMDDDPKTAEIITKVLLFAEDSKIKDPSIRSQINHS